MNKIILLLSTLISFSTFASQELCLKDEKTLAANYFGEKYYANCEYSNGKKCDSNAYAYLIDLYTYSKTTTDEATEIETTVEESFCVNTQASKAYHAIENSLKIMNVEYRSPMETQDERTTSLCISKQELSLYKNSICL